MMTGTGTPLSRVGVNSHCLTASSAAWSSSGIERSTLAASTLPRGPIVASMMTMPWTRADCAIGGIDRVDVARLGRRLDVAADADGLGWGRGRRRLGQAADDTTDDATGHAALDTAYGAFEAGVDRGFLLDFLGRLNRCGVRVDVGRGHRRGLRGGGRRGRRWWRRWRRRRSHEGHHRRHLRQRIGRQQRDDDDADEPRRVDEDRKRDRVPLLAAHLDGRIDYVAEHVTWHERLLLRTVLRAGADPQTHRQRSAAGDTCTAQPARRTASYRVRHHMAEFGSAIVPARGRIQLVETRLSEAARRIARLSAPGPRGSGRTRWAPASGKTTVAGGTGLGKPTRYPTIPEADRKTGENHGILAAGSARSQQADSLTSLTAPGPPEFASGRTSARRSTPTPGRKPAPGHGSAPCPTAPTGSPPARRPAARTAS